MSSAPPSPLERIDAVAVRDHYLIASRHGEGTVGETPDKVAALLDTARVLRSIDTPYALIGGVAVGIHSGVPRATADTDVAVWSTHDRALIVQALTAAGFRLVGQHPHSANFRHSSGEPVQLAFDEAFDPMIKRAETFLAAGVSVCLVRKADLVEMKRRAAADPAQRRSKALRDQADVELLLGDVPDPDEGW